MSFVKNFESMAKGRGGDRPGAELPPHSCAGCQTQMQYRGPHTIRTGGCSEGSARAPTRSSAAASTIS